MTIKALVISNLYPSSAMPRNGIFTEHRIRNLTKSGEVEAKVVVPTPWVPSFFRNCPRYRGVAKVPHREQRYGLDIYYPRYLCIPKIGMTLSPFLLAASLVRLVNTIRKEGYDFDLIDAYYFYPDGVAATLLGLYYKKPVVITAYGNDISLIPQYLPPRLLIQWAAKKCSGITAVCKALKDRLVELGAAEEKTKVVLHGVDLELFHPPVDRDSLRAKLGMSRKSLFSVGHLIERKGHDITIKAMSQLPDFELYIAGDGEEEAALKQLTASLGLEERVHFLGHVNQEELPDYYGAADALVLASSREGIANVLMESMACGTPVVATNIWGSPEVVNTPEAGVLIPERTPDSLAESVLRLFSSYPDRNETRRYSEEFTWERTTLDHLAVLTPLIHKPRAPS